MRALLLILLPLLVAASPRQREVFSGVPMVRSSNLAFAVMAEPSEDITPIRFAWFSSGDATGYKVHYWTDGPVKTIATENLSVIASFTNLTRCFGYVTATNDWGESDPSITRHFPPYSKDRVTISSKGRTNFSLESSVDGKRWTHFTNAASPVTVLGNKALMLFRGVGATNELLYNAYNPLNN